MTEHCFQPPNSTDFAIFSTIFSHPLYLSYLIFFSPYLLKLISFLSPLFMTTSLLFLSLLTTIVPLHSIISSKHGFLLAVYNVLLEELKPQFDNEGYELDLGPFEELEVYKIVFETPIIGVTEENPDETERFEENPDEFLSKNLKKNNESQSVSHSRMVCQEQREVTLPLRRPIPIDLGFKNPDKVKEQVKKFESIFNRSGSDASKIRPMSEILKPKYGSMRVDNEKKLPDAFSQTVGGQPYLRNFGSMRKEKEWRRTLACKLFEERHNGNLTNVKNGGGGEEIMDLLWESHETESNRGELGKTNKKVEESMAVMSDDHEKDDEDYDENGKLCCLQALKLSAGKMNLNMGKPNLIKFSKAFKGIGWLQSHVRRQGKKGYK